MRESDNERRFMLTNGLKQTNLLGIPPLSLLFAACFLFLGNIGPAACVNSQQATEQQVLPTHHSKDGFDNPHLQKEKHGFLKYLKMRHFSGEEYADYASNAHKVPTMAPDLERIRNPGAELQVTWVGHATILIQYRGLNILTDPMFSDRASPLSFSGPKRYHPPALPIEDLPKIDYIVLSHNHYDHLDKKSVQALGSGPLWLVPLRLKEWFVDAGINKDRVIEFDWWDTQHFSPVTLTATPAQHWSARTLWDRKKTLWSSWMLEIDDRTIWYSGDTGYNPYQFQEIGEKFPKIDLALISIGAYEPRWFMKDMHINPAEAVQIHKDINSRYSLGIQWGSFQLTAEPIDDPPIKLREALVKNGLPLNNFETMMIGETKEINK
ncbi:MAG: MBL fold metallo-hydrolase [Thermodesulfobacteriota bacterium]